MPFIAASAIIAMLALAPGQSAVPPNSSAVGDQFVCDSLVDGLPAAEIDAREIMMARAYHADFAGGGPVEMAQLATKDGFRFAGPGLLLEGKGDRATLTNSYNSVECTRGPVTVQPQADSGFVAAPVMAASSIEQSVMSWGGKLRGGPGMTYEQVGSSSEGQQLALLSDSGIAMNGYDWFQVRTRNGLTAYIWGGLLCSGDQEVAGLYEGEGCHVDGVSRAGN